MGLPPHHRAKSELSGAAGNTTRPRPETAGRTGGWLLGVAIVLAAVNLRPAVASVGPVLDDIRLDLGLSGAAASVLTALPILCFGAGALVAPRLARRFSSEITLVAVFAATTVGLVLRLGPDAVTLFAGTFLAGAAIAVANVLIPAMVKREFASRTGLMMGLYVGVTVVGASVAAAIAVPAAEALGGQWRAGLGVWALPAALAFAVWVAVTASRRRRSVPDDRTTDAPTSLLGDPVAWQVTVFMGLQSLGFYALLSWLPSVYRSYGISPEVAGQLLSLMIILGVPTALLFPSLLTRSAQQSGWALAATALIGAGLLGLLLAPSASPYVWATLIGIGMGAAFPLALTLVVLRTRDVHDAAQLSTMSQSVGYVLAAAGPFVFGLLHDLSHGWMLPVGFLLVLLVPQTIAGL
ncbi:MAG: MFS transporter, partial [Nitriliruptorales bacterium]|nr:MFS transporter [Nitriliruptorales bacterium]